MRWAIVVLLASATAYGRPASVEDVVRTMLMHNADAKQLAPTLRPDAIVVFDDTLASNATADDAATYLGSIQVKSVGAIKVAIDDKRHVAAFQGTADALTVDQTGDGCGEAACAPVRLKLHFAGIARDDGGWKLAVVILSRTEPDQLLVQKADPNEPVPAAPRIIGDAKLATAVGEWFTGARIAKASAKGTVFAAGTAPDEIGTGPAAVRLTTTWDKMKMAAASIDARLITPELGFVYVTTKWPYKAGTVDMRLAAIAIREAQTWTWLVLDFGYGAS